jgi:hypothetical protein
MSASSTTYIVGDYGNAVGGVDTVTAGTAISLSGTASNPVINNTGVQTVTAGSNITNTGTATNPILNATGLGVQTVTSGIGISLGGTITNPIVNNAGVIALTAGTGIVLTGTATNPIVSSTVDGVQTITAGTGIVLTGTAVNPIISSTVDGVQTITAGTGITLGGTAVNPIINSTVDGVQTITAGTNITIGGTAVNPIINSTAVGGATSNTVVINQAINTVSLGTDTDTSLFSVPLTIPASINLNLVNTISVRVATGGLAGYPTSGATNASFISFYGKANGTGAVITPKQGMFILYDRNSCGAPNSPPTAWDLVVNFSKVLGHFNPTSTTLDIIKTSVDGAPFSSAVGNLYGVPTYSVSMTGF